MDRTTPPTHRHAQSLPLADAFRDQFSDEDIDRIVADHGICFRKRLFTPAVTLRTFFNQVFHAGASCRNAVIRLYAARLPTTRPDIRCKSPSMVRKEIAMHVLVFNAVRAVMVKAGAGVNREPSRLSFTAAREAIVAFAPQLSDPAFRERALAAMLE